MRTTEPEQLLSATVPAKEAAAAGPAGVVAGAVAAAGTVEATGPSPAGAAAAALVAPARTAAPRAEVVRMARRGVRMVVLSDRPGNRAAPGRRRVNVLSVYRQEARYPSVLH